MPRWEAFAPGFTLFRKTSSGDRFVLLTDDEPPEPFKLELIALLRALLVRPPLDCWPTDCKFLRASLGDPGVLVQSPSMIWVPSGEIWHLGAESRLTFIA